MNLSRLWVAFLFVLFLNSSLVPSQNLGNKSKLLSVFTAQLAAKSAVTLDDFSDSLNFHSDLDISNKRILLPPTANGVDPRLAVKMREGLYLAPHLYVQARLHLHLILKKYKRNWDKIWREQNQYGGLFLNKELNPFAMLVYTRQKTLTDIERLNQANLIKIIVKQLTEDQDEGVIHLQTFPTDTVNAAFLSFFRKSNGAFEADFIELEEDTPFLLLPIVRHYINLKQLSGKVVLEKTISHLRHERLQYAIIQLQKRDFFLEAYEKVMRRLSGDSFFLEFFKMLDQPYRSLPKGEFAEEFWTQVFYSSHDGSTVPLTDDGPISTPIFSLFFQKLIQEKVVPKEPIVKEAMEIIKKLNEIVKIEVQKDIDAIYENGFDTVLGFPSRSKVQIFQHLFKSA